MSLMYKNFKLNENQILEESLLKSQMTFGFELEAVADGGYYEDYSTSDDEGYYDDEEEDHYIESSEMSRAIDNNLEELFNKYKGEGAWKAGTMQEDGSVNGSDDDDFPFEWASPVMEFKPSELNRTIKFLNGLKNIGVYTNDSCGFHHHISWKGITERDMIWTYTNLILDEDFIKEMLNLKTRDNTNIKIWSNQWSGLKNMGSLREFIQKGEWDKALTYYSDDKYRLFRIHPYGTIEWRGPRDFLNYRNLDYIKDFYKKFNKLASKIIECQSMKTLFGTNITKEEFFNNLKKAQESEKAPHPNEDMRDGLEFLYRTGTYRGDRKFRIKRDGASDDESYLTPKYIKALNKKPLLLYKEIKKCQDLDGFAKIIKTNELIGVFVKLSQMSEVTSDKEFLDKLLNIMLLITDDISSFDDYIGTKLTSYLNLDDLMEKYTNVVNNSKNSNAFIGYLDYMREHNRKIDAPTLIEMIRKFAKYDMKTLCVYSNNILNYVISQEMDKSVIMNIINMILKMFFRLGLEYNYCEVGSEYISENITNENEKVKWDENILGAIFEKPLASFVSYLLPVDNEDVNKGIIAAFRRYNLNTQNLNSLVFAKIKQYVED